MVTISAQQMYDIVQRTEAAAERIANEVGTLTSTVGRLEDLFADHENRLRVVESRTDLARRMEGAESRLAQHDAAFTKQGERVGAIEGQLASRLNPAVVAGVVAAFLAIAVNVVLYVLKV